MWLFSNITNCILLGLELWHCFISNILIICESENEEKVGFLWEMKGAKERLKIMKADLMEEGSFDEAIQGVDGVFHAAAPVLVPYDENVYVLL